MKRQRTRITLLTPRIAGGDQPVVVRENFRPIWGDQPGLTLDPSSERFQSDFTHLYTNPHTPEEAHANMRQALYISFRREWLRLVTRVQSRIRGFLTRSLHARARRRINA